MEVLLGEKHPRGNWSPTDSLGSLASLRGSGAGELRPDLLAAQASLRKAEAEEQLELTITALVGIHVHGMTISHARGFGQTHDQRNAEDLEYLAAEIPKFSRLEIACQDDDVEAIFATLTHAANVGNLPGFHGSGKVLVLPLTDALRIKTGERGEAAIGRSGKMPPFLITSVEPSLLGDRSILGYDKGRDFVVRCLGITR